MDTSSRTLKQRAYHEIKEYLVITLYLWVVFVLFRVHESVVLAEHRVDYARHGLAFVNALALAKVMLVGRKLRLADQLHDAPLIYPTLLKSAIFSVVLACFKILEEVVIGLYRGQSLHERIADIGGGSWKGILTVTVMMCVVLIPFFGFTELQRVFGEGKLEEVFFRRR